MMRKDGAAGDGGSRWGAEAGLGQEGAKGC